MARDILGEYGPEAHKPQAGRATSGGVEQAKDVMHYRPAEGPLYQHFEHPGLGGGTNCGSGQKPVSYETSGSPGNHGTNHGNKGSQGEH